MARKATWLCHVDTRACVAWMTCTRVIIHILYIIIMFRGSPVYKGTKILICSIQSMFYSEEFPKYFPCGTKFCVLLTVHATWRNVERRIKGPIDRHASIVWSADHRIAIKPRALNRSVITAEMRRRGSHLSRQIKIEGAKSKAFYNVSLTITSGPSIAIGRLRYFRNGPRWTVSS